MKKIYLLFVLSMTYGLSAQDSRLYYSGIFLNEKGKSQSSLKILNKNSGLYELTDEKGFAVIEAKPYDTLVWNSSKNKIVIQPYTLQELATALRSRIKSRGVENIYSKAYDSITNRPEADLYSIEKAGTYLSNDSDRYFLKIRSIRRKNDTVFQVKQLLPRKLVISGSLTSSFEIRQKNTIPETQNRFVQGRPEGGLPVWRGPETDEIFSFGPAISTLGFDQQPYVYDRNGRLVGLSEGVSPATAYRNALFRTTVGSGNQLKMSAAFKNGYDETFRGSLDLGHKKDRMYFDDQFNTISFFTTKFYTRFKGYVLNAAFAYDSNKATETNRAGLFNRAYRNSLLTPVSFSNAQSLLLPDGSQRRYSRFADNPLFLLNRENPYNYYSNRRQFSFDVSKTWRKITLNISQSYENDRYWNRDAYKISTYKFMSGTQNERKQNDVLYNSRISAHYAFGDYDFKNTFSSGWIVNDNRSEVSNSFTGREYAYQRTSQDYFLNYGFEHHGNDLELGASAGNAFYISNTSRKNAHWLPKASGYILFEDIFGWRRFNLKALGAYTTLSSEPEITKSYAFYTTTLLKAEKADQYFPVYEAETFRGLFNTGVKEWKAGFRFDAGSKITLEGEFFSRKIENDVFPVFENNLLVLKNLADHIYKGYEFNFSFASFRLGTHLYGTQKISFFRYRDTVSRVESGYDHLAVSGFSDVYKALQQGEVLGVVTGSHFLRNSDRQVIIDESGFPVKAGGLQVIADPTPDFIMKSNHHFIFKRLTLDISWEWKKGGKFWNGTQAALDYYGRSQVSADQRQVRNYVFDGVTATGAANTVPVDFFNPGQEVLENRWSRYGFAGVAEDYIQKADYIRINTISLSLNLPVDQTGTSLLLTFYVNNLLLWQAARGADSNQNFYDQENGRGLDFFNLPSFKTFGCTVSFKF